MFKLSLNSYAEKDTICGVFLTKKDPKLSLSELLSMMTRIQFNPTIHMTFYVNPSWTCTLFRNNKQHVVLGQKRKCQRMEESGLWRIQRERNRSAVSSKWNKCRISVGTNWRKCYASKLTLKWQRFCLIGVSPGMLPSFLNRFSYFMNLWWCLWSFSVDIIQYM